MRLVGRRIKISRRVRRLVHRPRVRDDLRRGRKRLSRERFSRMGARAAVPGRRRRGELRRARRRGARGADARGGSVDEGRDETRGGDAHPPPAPETVDNRTLLSTPPRRSDARDRRSRAERRLPPRVPSHGRARDETRDDHGQRRRRAVPGDGGKDRNSTRRRAGKMERQPSQLRPNPSRARRNTSPNADSYTARFASCFEGADKYDNLHATVLFAGNGAPVDVAAALVSEGLAKVVDWSVALRTDPDRGRAAAARGGEKSEGRAGEDLGRRTRRRRRA